MGLESILNSIANITDGGRNTALEFRTVLTDMTGTLSGDTISTTEHIADDTIHYEQSGITITSSQISNFDTEVSNNLDVAANTLKETNIAHPFVGTEVPVGALFTDTGLEALDEGNGIGWRLIGRPHGGTGENGNIGLNGVDFSYGNAVSWVDWGATGDFSFAQGQNVRATDIYCIAMGYSSEAMATNAIAIGSHSHAEAPNSIAIGNGGTYATRTDAVAIGKSCGADGVGSTTLGYGTSSLSLGETAVGMFNDNTIPLSASTYSLLDKIFSVGNGTTTGTRSNALTILKNGLATLPSVTNTLISGDAKSIITKEYGDANYLGGGGSSIYALSGTSIYDIGGSHTISGSTYSVISGGQNNTASGNYNFISGGQENTVNDKDYATVGGGYGNTVSADYATISGGYNNTASGENSTISGGYGNTADGPVSFIGGGYKNKVSGFHSFIGGGIYNEANSYGEWVGGIYGTTISGSTNTIVATDRLFNIGNGINTSNRSDALTILKNGLATLPSITNTLISGDAKAIITKEYGDANYLGGGGASVYALSGSSIYDLGGSHTVTDSTYSVISGGRNNIASNDYTTVSGGRNNTASNNYYATVSGGEGNTASDWASTVSGGQNNEASGENSTVSGGYTNTASAYVSTVAGGYGNTASGDKSTVGGGQNNTASGYYSVISGGYTNTASAYYATVSGGYNNTASGYNSTVAGGYLNIANGDGSTVSGGFHNEANSYVEWVGGIYGTTIIGNATTFVATDRLFNIGNGLNDGTRSDALTILKNGLATLPSVTNTLISGNTKSIVTKEYGDANYLGGGGVLYGTTAERLLAKSTPIGVSFWDTDLKIPCYLEGTTWYNAAGGEIIEEVPQQAK